jgi:hypothetical protein
MRNTTQLLNELTSTSWPEGVFPVANSKGTKANLRSTQARIRKRQTLNRYLAMCFATETTNLPKSRIPLTYTRYAKRIVKAKVSKQARGVKTIL